MKKIWQKSLASMVSAALCLTAFVGCLTVNAADYQGTITSAGTEITTAAAEAQIDLVVSADVPAGAKGMACAGLKVTTEYGKLTNAVVTSGEAYVETKSPEGEVESATPDIGADGQFIVWAKDTKTGVSSFTVRLTFTPGSVTAGTTYPVNVDYLGTKADIGAANWDEKSFAFTTNVGKITVKSSHTHTWDAGVMTTMPTTTSDGVVTDGVITYTCECGETKQEAFSVNGTITENSAKILADVGLVKSQYSVKISADVFSSLKDKGATDITFGMLLTKEGSIPSFENTATSKLYEYVGTIPPGKAATDTGYFQNMNFNQMGLTLSFRPFVKFIYQEQVCYCYGNTYARDFITLIRDNTDDKSIALINLYDSVAQASNVNTQCSGSVLESGNNTSITTRVDKTFYNMAATKIQYGVQIPADVFSGIKAENGTGINFGMLLTKDGTAPSFENTATSILYKYTSDIPAGKNATASGYFQNMNLKQMGQTLTFRPYVSYINSNDEVTYIYGDAVSFVYIDILRTLEADTYASALVSYYDTYIVAN